MAQMLLHYMEQEMSDFFKLVSKKERDTWDIIVNFC